MLSIPVTRTHSDLPLPAHARLNDAGVDLLAAEAVTIAPASRAVVSTGLSIAIPAGYGGFVQPRSGLAVKHGITVLNSPGLIDAGYRGEIQIVLLNTDTEVPFKIERGDRIAQLVIQAVEHVVFEEVETLPADVVVEGGPAVRGSGGFGHSGV